MMIRVLVAAAAVGIGAASVQADSITVLSNHDNTIFSDLTSNSNGSGSGVFVGNNQQGGVRRGLISFDVSAIPAGSTITSVTLSMTMAQTVGGNINVALHRVTSAWGEGTSNGSGQGAAAQAGEATWTDRMFGVNPWAAAGGDFVAGASAFKSIGGVGTYQWASTPALVADVQGWLTNPSTNNGWIMIGDAVNGGAKRFNSRESGDERFVPSLSVEYTIVPGPASLALVAGAGLMMGRRRR